MFTGRTRLLLAPAALVGAAFVYAIEFTEWHQLQAVTLDGDPIENFDKRLGLTPTEPVTHQDLRVAADRLLKDDSTVKVDIDYDLPGGLKIETNRFEPQGFLVDARSGRMYGVNFQGRIVPLREDYDDWEHPMLTGVNVRGLYEPCADSRVSRVVPELARLADDRVQLYRVIEEIDFSQDEFLVVRVAGLPYRLRVEADSFFEQTTGFIRFLEQYHPDLDSAAQFDMRYAGMIIQENRKR